MGITSMSFDVRGGAGGSALTTGGAGCSAPGGEGAIASAVFTVGNFIISDKMDFSNIRRAGFEDRHLMAELFKLSTDHMISQGINQWNYTYPLVSPVEEDIHNRSAFVYIEAGKIVGTITLDSKQDDQYKKIHWHNHSRKVLVIHRLSVHPGFQGFGSEKNCVGLLKNLL